MAIEKISIHSASDYEHSGRAGLYPVKKARFDIQSLVERAARAMAPVWPIETFIACNPLRGYESLPFEQALAQGYGQGRLEEPHPALASVNREMIKWCSSFFEEGQSSLAMPHRKQGLYAAFRHLACFDKRLQQNRREAKQFLAQLPASASEAVELCLKTLQVTEEKAEGFILQSLLYLPGWAGYVKWMADWRGSEEEGESARVLLDFLAVRLVITCLFWPEAAQVESKPLKTETVQALLDQLQAKENAYRDRLLAGLLPALKKAEIQSTRKNAQLVFCIDVRSEPLRRALEPLGEYETFGFAGFFGIPVRVNALEASSDKACCPVLLQPRFSVEEKPSLTQASDIRRYQRGRAMIQGSRNLYSQLKHNFSTPFALVESLGFWCGLSMLFKSLAPRFSNRWLRFIRHWLAPKPPTKLAYELDGDGIEQGMSLQEQIHYAQTVLRLIGLTSGFAKLIVLCGHGSSSENNPYAAALDCGACGGNHGGINARLLASILNKPEVRQGLEECGMHIPFDTQFYGALHNTTTDEVELEVQDSPKPVYPELFAQLQADLNQAGQKTRQERGKKLGNSKSVKDAFRRGLDWSETRPEWGLAGNAAFIAAPRQLTQSLDLEGRCFLHSYCWEQDEDGALLEAILTAPMVVAEWINTQYLFSTLDNVAFGSGSKITHNVVGRIGIMQGNGSDLMHGLPLQSVMSTDEERYHQPQRLLVVVHAPRDRVFAVIERQPVLKTLFENHWLHLLVIDPQTEEFYQFNQTEKRGFTPVIFQNTRC